MTKNKLSGPFLTEFSGSAYACAGSYVSLERSENKLEKMHVLNTDITSFGNICV